VPGKTISLSLLTICSVAALSVWLSASAVVSAMRADTAMSDTHAALLTSAVQAGFVAGTLTSAILGLADRLDPRRFFATCAFVAALANGALLIVDPASGWVIAARFATGITMAGIYPVGMKIATTWARGDMGLLVGILVGGVTIGTGLPHLYNASAGLDWRATIASASLAALAAGVVINFVALGPNLKPAAPFNPGAALDGFRKPALRYANVGYLGHMWELYAVWAWLILFLEASFALNPGTHSGLAAITAFAVIAVAGGVGCIMGGFLADRIGRTTLAISALAVSGSCALVVGFLFGASPWILIPLCLIWGVAVIADSAQFSTATAELAPPERIGTMLTVQTCAGFLLTLITIHLMPHAISALGWRYAFAVLAIGPVLGIVAMIKLRRHTDAVKLAGGRR
jgi:MFS family permease